MNNINRVKKDDAIVGTTQVVNALSEQGHRVLGRETLDVKIDVFKRFFIEPPKNAKKIVVIYLE